MAGKLKEKAVALDHDRMAVTIIASRTMWKGRHTRDILVPQTNFPKIHVQVEETTKMVYFYDKKLRNVTSGRNLSSMVPSDVLDVILEKLSKNNGILYDGKRYFARCDGSRSAFEEGIHTILDNERYVLKNPTISLAFLSSGQSRYLSSSFEDNLKGTETLTAFIVTGKETYSYKDEGGQERLNKLGIRKTYKKAMKGERSVTDLYANISDLETVDRQAIKKSKIKEIKKIKKILNKRLEKTKKKISGATRPKIMRVIETDSEDGGTTSKGTAVDKGDPGDEAEKLKDTAATNSEDDFKDLPFATGCRPKPILPPPEEFTSSDDDAEVTKGKQTTVVTTDSEEDLTSLQYPNGSPSKPTFDDDSQDPTEDTEDLLVMEISSEGSDEDEAEISRFDEAMFGSFHESQESISKFSS